MTFSRNALKSASLATLLVVILLAASCSQRDRSDPSDVSQRPPSGESEKALTPEASPGAANGGGEGGSVAGNSRQSTNGELILHGSRERPKIALTFDSNMTPYMLHELDSGKVESFYNAEVLETLIATKTKATFFLSGLWIERYEAQAAAIAANPLFEIASHSYSHRAFHAPCYGLGAAMTFDEQVADVAQSLGQLRRLTPRATNYFRFPGGCYDEEAVRAASLGGAQCIQYDVVSGDAFNSNPRSIIRSVLDGAQNGSIVVMHVTGGNTAPRTAEALPEIISGLRAEGFELVTLSELLAEGH